MSKRREFVDKERVSLVERIIARSTFNSEQGIPDGDDNELQHWCADLELLDRKRLETLGYMADSESAGDSERCYRSAVLRRNPAYRDTY